MIPLIIEIILLIKKAKHSLCPVSHTGQFAVFLLFAVILKVQFARKYISGSHPNTTNTGLGMRHKIELS